MDAIPKRRRLSPLSEEGAPRSRIRASSRKPRAGRPPARHNRPVPWRRAPGVSGLAEAESMRSRISFGRAKHMNPPGSASGARRRSGLRASAPCTVQPSGITLPGAPAPPDAGTTRWSLAPAAPSQKACYRRSSRLISSWNAAGRQSLRRLPLLGALSFASIARLAVGSAARESTHRAPEAPR